MKHCKIILLVGLLASSASALAEKIGVSMAYFDQNFLTIIRQSIEKEAQARHVDVQFEDARGDTGRQADQVQSFIASGVDAIIVDPVDSASTPQLTKMAQQAKMPLVYVNRTPGDKTLPPGVVFVGSDERESGTLQMEALAKLANYKGNVAIMIGNLTDAGALQRTKDVEQVVAKYPAMKVVQKQPANYSRSEGMDLMQNWTGNGEAIDIVAANNDEMAIGAAMAAIMQHIGRSSSSRGQQEISLSLTNAASGISVELHHPASVESTTPAFIEAELKKIVQIVDGYEAAEDTHIVE